MSSSSSSVSVSGSGMDRLFMILTCGWPCNLLNRVSLQLMGSQGHSCLLLAIKTVDWSLVLSSSEFVLVVSDSKKHGLSDDVLVVGDEGSGGV